MTQAIRTTTTAIALIALFVSLGGTGFGASQLVLQRGDGATAHTGGNTDDNPGST
jgi:hypothetical protein